MLRSPLNAKYHRELLQVLNSSSPDSRHGIRQPSNAHLGEAVFEKCRAELRREERDVLDDCEPHAPLPVLGQLHDRGEQRLREGVDAHNLIHALQLGDNVESCLVVLVLQERQEERDKLLDRVALPEHGGEPHDDLVDNTGFRV